MIPVHTDRQQNTIWEDTLSTLSLKCYKQATKLLHQYEISNYFFASDILFPLR
jgi:hypothetical protein